MDLKKPIPILIAEDDEDDRLLTKEAFEESRIRNELVFVEDGEKLMHYLKREGEYSGGEHPLPGLIILDLNMPRKDGREALAEIKGDSTLRKIPVVVLTTSAAEADILHSYDLGVAGYIVKPVTFDGLVQALEKLGSYWLEIVHLPHL